jgi:signal transduction histidine kinase
MHSNQPEILQAGEVIPASTLLRFPRLWPTFPALPGSHEGDQNQGDPNGGGHSSKLHDLLSSELAHDARNLISALDVYCELLSSPGVLTPRFRCYADDLRKLATSGTRLIEALAGIRAESLPQLPAFPDPSQIDPSPSPRRPIPVIEDLGAELDAMQGSLRALAGPGVRLEIESRPCAGRLTLNSEELLRILFNLVANAVEAMGSAPAELLRRPFLRITAQRGVVSLFDRLANGGVETVVLSVRDNGPGIRAEHLNRVFDSGFSTRPGDDNDDSRGLGLAIVRRLVTAAGGMVRVVSPAGLGARFDIELPVLPAKAPGPRRKLAAPAVGREVRDLQQISAQIEKEA